MISLFRFESSRAVAFRAPRLALFSLLASLVAAPVSLAQSFLAEWNAASSGGVGPVGLVIAEESGGTFLYVADQPRGRVLKFNTASGAIAGVFGQQGNANGEFNSPYGLARDPASGDLYVAERGNNRISRITSSGAFVMSWGGLGTAPGQFTEPVGVAVDAAGDVYVTDHANNRVQKFRVAQSGGAWSATHLASWGSAGAGNGQFNLPYGIAADAAGNIWVADGFNGRVQRFNTSGQFQSVLGATGTAPGQFIVATGVALAPNGDVLVTSTNSNPQNGALADVNNQWVSRFAAAGAFVSRFGGQFGEAPGQFRLPFAAVAGPNNRLYVSDYYNSRIQVFDLSTNNPGTPGTPDTTPPAVASFTTGASTATSVAFQLVFTEAVTGVDAADFSVVITGSAVATVGAPTGSGTSYTIPVTFTGSGTVQLNVNATGTGIVDASNNAFAGGATGPVFTIGSTGGNNGGGGTGAGTQIIAVTPPPSGTYEKNQELVFRVRFSGNVIVGTGKDGKKDDDDDDGGVFFTWTAVGRPDESGKVHYISGSGTDTLVFRYKVKNGDLAPAGLLLGTVLQVDDGAVLRDASGASLSLAQRTISWPQNPLAGVILDAPKPGQGNGSEGNNGNGNGNNGAKGRDRLVNLSSRLRVTGGDASRSVVAGFVVTGEAPKQILIRAVGPGLSGFGIRDALPQPVLQLRDAGGRIVAENDGWRDRAELDLAAESVGAFKLPRGSRDAALLASLAPGAYTAQVFANGNGLVLLEVYDTTSGAQIATEQIVNISTRGFVGTGDDVLVAGFVVTGREPKRVLIRGIGPALSSFGVPGVLADPVLKLFRAGSANPLAQNDQWETPLPLDAAHAPATGAQIAVAAAAAGAFPLPPGSNDAALVVTLAPGNYSAIVSGANNGTGAGLVEIYELP